MEFPTVVAQPPLPVDEEMASMMASFVGKPPEEHPVTELVLYTAPRVHRFEDKAGFAPTPGLGGLDTRRSRRARRSLRTASSECREERAACTVRLVT